MRLIPVNHFDVDLFSIIETQKPNQSRVTMKEALGMDSSVKVTISEEGQRILSEEKGKHDFSQYEVKNPGEDDLTPKDVNVDGELMMEHYWAIGRAENKKSDNSEDYARAIMGGYEAVYHEIMKIHETGDREFSSLYGKGTVTLEEDLRALDLAFERKLGNMDAYIQSQQMRKVMGKVDLSIPKTPTYVPGIYDFRDPQYIEDMIEMMKRAKKEFEESYQSRGYQKFTGSNIISRIISENPEFSFKTKLLFFEVK